MPIPFTPIAIQSISATTPSFAGIEEIFAAACNSTRPPAPRVTDTFETLTRRAIDQLPHANATNPHLLLATTKADIAAQTQWMRQADSPEGSPLPPPTLSTALHHLHRHTHLPATHVVSTACTSGLVALIDAALLITDGDAPSILTLGADTATDFIRDGFTALKALSPTACRPFDKNRNGLTLGSAAAACLLAPAHAANPLAFLTGFGISNDATHMTAPDRNAGGLIRAIQSALHRARLQPADIDVIFAHGTGTPYNDAMEAVAIQKIFLSAGASPAVTAAKGLIGHTLGAAGLIEAVLAVQMLSTQTLLPITGLQTPEHPAINFVTAARKTKIQHILKIASGFGGMNAAIILSHPESVSKRETLALEGMGKASIVATSAAIGSWDAMQAMEPLIQKIPPHQRGSTGLVLGTTWGCLGVDLEFDRSRRDANGRYASPASFSRTLPSTIAAELALKFGLTGPSLVLSAGDNSTATAVRRAVAWMRHLNLDFCIAGGIDMAAPEFGRAEESAIALLLLSQECANPVAKIELETNDAPNLAARCDSSLMELGRWINNPVPRSIGG